MLNLGLATEEAYEEWAKEKQQRQLEKQKQKRVESTKLWTGVRHGEGGLPEKKRIETSARLKAATWNTCGCSEAVLRFLQGKGYDLVTLVETRGEEQAVAALLTAAERDPTLQDGVNSRLIVGEAPPPNDPAGGVAILVSRDLLKFVTG